MSDEKRMKVSAKLPCWQYIPGFGTSGGWSSPSGMVDLREDGYIQIVHTFKCIDSDSVKDELDEAVEAARVLEEAE